MNTNAYQTPGGINPAVLAALKPAKLPPSPSAPAVSPAQVINAAQSSQSRQQKMDEQRQAARIQILQQGMGLYPRPTPAPKVPDSAPSTPAPLPPIPALPPSTTRITIVPLLTSPSSIPPLSSAEIHDMKEWMRADREYEGVFRGMRERMAREAAGRGRGWWEKGFVIPGSEGAGAAMNRWRRAREVFEVRYPRRKERERRRGRREGLRLPRKLDIRDVNKPEQLVPIRLEFDVEHHKMRDTFVWNLNDPVVTPEAFAQSVVEDYALSPSYHAIITKSIQDQLSDFRAHCGMFDPESGDMPMPVVDLNEKEADPTRGRLEEEDEGMWWAQWRGHVCAKARGRSQSRGGKRKKRRLDAEDEGVDGDVEDASEEDDDGGWEKGKRLDEMEVDEAKTLEEMRILIRLDIIVGSMKLDDQFEWDLESESVTPEEFAEVYVQDLGLNGEFKTAIAHSIREQVQTYQKSLFLVGHPSDGSAVQDEDLRMSFLPSLTSAARPLDQITSYTPTLNYLSDGELDRTEKEREKDMNRRRKRNTRGRRGIALPDREPIRTYRTPAIGFPELDPATLALAAAANAPVSRRAAAAAASLTIANMVASENGTAFLPQVAVPTMSVVPSQQQPMLQKDGGGGSSSNKKSGGGAGAKGHFKAPVYPSEVLSPRAGVSAPTPSTAADVAVALLPASALALGAAVQTPDSARQPKYITAKKAKELEREAKEKEFAEGQHPNLIDGVWHCSNCGCPDSIAVGRRKGPLGDKSQCGVCGKYWHRHRRPRPVEYNPDPEYHIGLKREMEQSKAAASAKKKGGGAAAAALRATQGGGGGGGGDLDTARPTPTPTPADDRAVSPVSTASSASEPPLAQRVKANGAQRRVTSPPPPAPETPVLAPATTTSPNKTPGSKVLSSPVSPLKNAEPPQWLTAAKAAMMARYPNDKFETILRKVNAGSQPEWRIKCLDCPGKLYTPGPGETLANYEVHLKNRQHRQRVNDRLNNEVDS